MLHIRFSAVMGDGRGEREGGGGVGGDKGEGWRDGEGETGGGVLLGGLLLGKRNWTL